MIVACVPGIRLELEESTLANSDPLAEAERANEIKDMVKSEMAGVWERFDANLRQAEESLARDQPTYKPTSTWQAMPPDPPGSHLHAVYLHRAESPGMCGVLPLMPRCTGSIPPRTRAASTALLPSNRTSPRARSRPAALLRDHPRRRHRRRMATARRCPSWVS